MRSDTSRKTPRFFIINPIRDRRIECRFESAESVALRIEETGKEAAAMANDIGRAGLRLETPIDLQVGDRVQIAFQNRPESIRCFGHVAWCRPQEEGTGFEAGVSLESWYGIVNGAESWKQFKGVRVKRDRRRKIR